MKEPLRMNQLLGVCQVTFTKQTVSMHSPFRKLQRISELISSRKFLKSASPTLLDN